MSVLTAATAIRLVPLAFADALERELDDGSLLTVGSPRGSISEVVSDEPVHVVAVTLRTDDGTRRTIACVARASFAETLENAASDELLITTCGPALEAAAQAMRTVLSADIVSDPPRRVDLESIIAAQDDNESAVYPILDGTLLVACLAVLVEAPHASATFAASGSSPATGSVAANDPVAGTTLLLTDVEMGVTAELGRCRMTVRELLSLTSGAVIDLDRPVGAPVDIVVNGTPIARGEVVVIDEEFGIRITELLNQASSSH